MAKYPTYKNLQDEHTRWFKVGELPGQCLHARMSLTGATDLWQEEEYDSFLRYLKHRIECWEDDPSTVREGNPYDFDGAIKTMVLSTIYDLERRWTLKHDR